MLMQPFASLWIDCDHGRSLRGTITSSRPNSRGLPPTMSVQLMHFENGAAFNPRNMVSNLYGKFNPQMMGDYRREWAQEELLKGKRTDRDQVVWLLEWLKVAKAYYNADPKSQPIPLGMPMRIATEFQGKTQTPKGGSTSTQ